MPVKRLIPWFSLVFLACQLGGVTPIASPAKTAPTPISQPTLTLQPYEEYTVDFLRKRTYGGGEIEIVETIEETDSLTRSQIRYPSDDLNITGFANVPKGEGPFPVIIAIHGFVDPAIYEPLDYTTPTLDRLTQDGYIIFHPDLRNYSPSDKGDNLFRVGMAMDVLNLMGLIQTQSGPSELFATAASEKIGLLGQSMGGNIALRVLTVSSDIKATVLSASMSGDEIKNAQLLFRAFPDPAFQTELETSPEIVEGISLMNDYSNITSPIQLYHGVLDETVPVAWAEETCQALTEAGVQVECIYYPDEDHIFENRVLDQFYEAMLDFYELHLSP